MVGALLTLLLSPASAEVDLSQFGTPVEQAPAPNRTAKSGWSPGVCADILRMERMVTEDARPTDRGMLRIGLLLLQQQHCGVDIRAKVAADQRVLDEAQRKSQQRFQENIEAAARAATPPPAPSVVIQVPQASSAPDPTPSIHCFTTRLGGGMSTTNCQ